LVALEWKNPCPVHDSFIVMSGSWQRRSHRRYTPIMHFGGIGVENPCPVHDSFIVMSGSWQRRSHRRYTPVPMMFWTFSLRNVPLFFAFFARALCLPFESP
jgi:hypothetical protein